MGACSVLDLERGRRKEDAGRGGRGTLREGGGARIEGEGPACEGKCSGLRAPSQTLAHRWMSLRANELGQAHAFLGQAEISVHH